MTYKLVQIVQLRADPSRQGVITEILSPIGGVRKYRVFHSISDEQEYFENQLDPVATTGITSDPANALLQDDLLSSDEFRARITASRLSNPQADSLYSLYAARIQHIPFQFKPLLRFLRADEPRLLIADEVGVGKTIEAGLILRELQTRQEVENVLIVCPKALVLKWQEEMKRFDEDFRLLSAENLRYCINETHLDGVWPSQYARSIVHLELLRNDKYISRELQYKRIMKNRPKQEISKKKNLNQLGLKDLDPRPHFSLVIFDEAHHLRNLGNNSHEIARFLCDVSEAVLLLTATPVHLGSKNLYTLLHLLRDDLLPDFTVFQQMMEPNSHLIDSMRYVRTRSPRQNWQDKSLSAIKKAVNTDWGRQILRNDPIVVEWIERLSDQVELDEKERIRLLRDLEEVHTFAHLINRTRRRDIAEQFPIREPHTIEVSFTQPQKEFYEALIDFRRQVLNLQYDPVVIRLITNTVERQASSCLPALIPMLDNFIQSGRFSSSVVTDTDDLEIDEDTLNLPSSLVDMARDLRYLADNLPSDDPKLKQLAKIISRVLEISNPKKVLVFSYFLHTLAYLEQKLSLAGYRVNLITGKTPEEDRQELRRRFRLSNEDANAIDVLLSSEVGCEGLDYEFCDCLVNYDIPWNPMRIEQRIGRIDRFGQKSDKVLIYNFITPGTVEERIFFRCYERLDIFRNTVGDLEEVLGQVVQNLQQFAYYNPALTSEQAEEKARQMADNAIRRAEEQRRLEKESESLLGLDRAFTEEIDTLIDEGRFVAQNDLSHMVSLYVKQGEFGGEVMPNRQKPGEHILRLNKEARSAISNNASVQNRYDRPTLEFKRWLNGNKPTLSITYDQEIALEDRDIPFITPVHPLAKVAIAYWKDVPTPLRAKLQVRDSTLTVGLYFFVLYLWETVGVQSEVKLKVFAWDMNQNKLSEDVSAILLNLFERASDIQKIQFTTEVDIQRCIDAVEEAANKERLKAVQQLNQRNKHLLARRRATLESRYRNRLARVEAELNQSTNERIYLMKQAQKINIESEFERKMVELEQKRDSDIVDKRIAMGILQVQR